MYLHCLLHLLCIVILNILVLQSVRGDENNLAKFTGIDCFLGDPEYLDNITCRVKAVRRNLYHINIYINVIKPADNLVVRITLFKKANTFKPFLVRATEKLCDFLSKKHTSPYMKVLGGIYLPYSNVNSSCPLMGELLIKDMPLNGNSLPSIWPAGEYRLDVLVFRFGKLVVTIRIMFALEEKIRRVHF